MNRWANLRTRVSKPLCALVRKRSSQVPLASSFRLLSDTKRVGIPTVPHTLRGVVPHCTHPFGRQAFDPSDVCPTATAKSTQRCWTLCAVPVTRWRGATLMRSRCLFPLRKRGRNVASMTPRIRVTYVRISPSKPVVSCAIAGPPTSWVLLAESTLGKGLHATAPIHPLYVRSPSFRVFCIILMPDICPILHVCFADHRSYSCKVR